MKKIPACILTIISTWCHLLMAQTTGYPPVPGVVVDYRPASSGMYIGSPSICILPGGNHIASHDFFGPKSTENKQAITHIFSSGDKGKSWQRVSEINGQFWSKLFAVGNPFIL